MVGIERPRCASEEADFVAVGEGVEKKQEDFAAEVAKALQG